MFHLMCFNKISAGLLLFFSCVEILYSYFFFVSIALMLFKKLKTLGEVKSCLAITFAWPSKPSFDGNHRDSG